MDITFTTNYGVFTLDPATNGKIAGIITRDGFFAKDDIAILEHYVRADSVVIDVGAHVGLICIPLAKRAKSLFAFEPMPENRRFLKTNLRQNNISNVTVIPCALGASDGSVSMSPHDPANTGSNAVRGEGDIPMRTLDSMHFPRVDLIKIDVEGYEPAVLQGAQELLREQRPIVFFELFLPDLRKRYEKPLKTLEWLLPGYSFSINGRTYNHLWQALLFLTPKSFLFNRGGLVLNVLALPIEKSAPLGAPFSLLLQ